MFSQEIYIIFDFSIPIGEGVPQQHHQNIPRGSNKAMRLVRSSMQANLRLYRRSLNATENIFDRIRNVIMHDVQSKLPRVWYLTKYIYIKSVSWWVSGGTFTF